MQTLCTHQSLTVINIAVLESAFLVTLRLSLEVVAMDMPLEVSALCLLGKWSVVASVAHK